MSFGLPELLIIFVVSSYVWLFYVWGAGMAERKGYSRGYGWLAVFLGLIGVLVIALLSDQSAPKPRDVTEQLERLAALKDKGALTDDEFESQKRALLDQGHSPPRG